MGLDDIVLSWTGTGTTSPLYLLTDERGSVIGQATTTGAISPQAYDDYGQPATASGAFGYTGQMTLPGGDGLMHYRARAYDPALGRFLQPDPIGYDGGMNLYAYVGADPMNLIDPWAAVKGTPMARSTWLGSRLPEVQALPEEAQMP